MYTPPQAWPFSTWAVLAFMWHLAPEGTLKGTAEEISGTSTPGRPTTTSPGADPKVASWWRPRGRISASRQPTQQHPDKGTRPFLQTGTVPGAPSDSGWRWDAGEAQSLPDPWILPLWYLPTNALANATQAVKGTFPPPEPPGAALLRSLQAGAAWVRWREQKGRPGPYFPLVQGQALLHADDMGTVKTGAIVPDTACRWITAAAPQYMRPPPAFNRLLRTVPLLAPRHTLTRDVWSTLLSYPREWMATPGARYPPGPVLEQLTVSTPGVRQVLHRASAPTEQLTSEVLDLALEPLQVL